MPPDSERMRQIAVLLMVFVAGCVDAIGFVNKGIFPANMTGNAVLLSIALAGSLPLEHAKLPALVLFSFCGGVALGSLMMRSLRTRLEHGFNLVIFLAGLVIFLCGFSLFTVSVPFSIPHLLLIAAAMGMQSSAALELNFSGAGITTVITSTLTAAVSKIITTLYSVLASDKPTRISWPVFPILVFGIYSTGAFLGIFHGTLPLAAMILLSGFLLIGAAAVSVLSVRDSANPDFKTS